MYNTLDYWDFELCPQSGLKNTVLETGSVFALK
jgi:hypothetical protein